MDFPKCGYVILRNVLSQTQIDFGKSCINNDKMVNYFKVREFIQDHMFPIINKRFGWSCVYSK